MCYETVSITFTGRKPFHVEAALYSMIDSSHMWLIIYFFTCGYLSKITNSVPQYTSHTSGAQHPHWLVVTALDSADIEHFCLCRKFYWTTQIENVVFRLKCRILAHLFCEGEISKDPYTSPSLILKSHIIKDMLVEDEGCRNLHPHPSPTPPPGLHLCFPAEVAPPCGDSVNTI